MNIKLQTLEAAITDYQYPEGPKGYYVEYVEVTLTFDKSPIHTWRIESTDDEMAELGDALMTDTDGNRLADFVAERLKEAWFGGSNKTVYHPPK